MLCWEHCKETLLREFLADQASLPQPRPWNRNLQRAIRNEKIPTLQKTRLPMGDPEIPREATPLQEQEVRHPGLSYREIAYRGVHL